MENSIYSTENLIVLAIAFILWMIFNCWWVRFAYRIKERERKLNYIARLLEQIALQNKYSSEEKKNELLEGLRKMEYED